MSAPAIAAAGFVVDLERCVGCEACVVACRLENGWPSGAPWRRVLPLNLRRRPAGPTCFMSVACHHCERPACLAACPSGAYAVCPDGTVLHDAARCLGCRYCEMACPFDAPRFDPAAGVVGKCDLCRRRRERGEAPACVTACPTEALTLAPLGERRGDTRTPDLPGAAVEELRDGAPGFADPAACRPRLRFKPPRTRRRRARYDAVAAAMARADARRTRGR